MKTKIRGLEPIVAAVLLIVVAVIGAMLVYVWFPGYVAKVTSQAESMAASEKLKIEAASLTTSTRGVEATLYVRNLGGDKVTIATVYLIKPGTVTPLCYRNNINATINSGALLAVPVTFLGCALTAGYDYVIKLVTSKGTEFAVTVTAS